MLASFMRKNRILLITIMVISLLVFVLLIRVVPGTDTTLMVTLYKYEPDPSNVKAYMYMFGYRDMCPTQGSIEYVVLFKDDSNVKACKATINYYDASGNYIKSKVYYDTYIDYQYDDANIYTVDGVTYDEQKYCFHDDDSVRGQGDIYVRVDKIEVAYDNAVNSFVTRMIYLIGTISILLSFGLFIVFSIVVLASNGKKKR